MARFLIKGPYLKLDFFHDIIIWRLFFILLESRVLRVILLELNNVKIKSEIYVSGDNRLSLKSNGYSFC